MKKILVTGGAGFIGSHVVERLQEDGHEILVLDNFSTGHASNLGRDIQVVEADLLRPRAAAAVIAGFRPEAVMHLAAQVNVRRSIENPAFDADLNIVGSLHLLKACADHGVRRVVFASSGGAIYGDQGTFPIPETATPHPKSPYGISKHAVEYYGRYFSRAAAMEFVALRLANVYGPKQDPSGEAGVVAIFLEKLRGGVAPVVYGDGTHTRDYVWVGDVARAFALALCGLPGTYNIGTGTETGTLELFHHLKRAMESSLDPRFAAGIPGEVRRNSLDCALARRVLGWSPKVPLASGLGILVNSLGSAPQAQGVKDGVASP